MVAFSPITVLQTAAASDADLVTSSTTVPVTFTNSVTPGSAIVVFGFSDLGGADPGAACRDSINGDYPARLQALADATNSALLSGFVLPASTGGFATVNYVLKAARTAKAVCALEVGSVNLQSAGSNGQNQTNPGAGADAITTLAAAPPGVPALILGISVNVSAANVPAVGTGFTDQSAGGIWLFGGAQATARVESKRVITGVAAAATFTAGGGAGAESYQNIVVTLMQGPPSRGLLPAF